MGDEGNLDQAAEEVNAASVLLREERRKWKILRLKKEAKSAKKRALHSKHKLEESQKRAIEKLTIRQYFTSTCNADNKSDLDQLQGCANRPDLERKKKTMKELRNAKAEGDGLKNLAASRLTHVSTVSIDTIVGSTSRSGEAELEIDLLIPAVVSISSDLTLWVCSEDDPNFVNLHDHVSFESDFDLTDDETVDSDEDLDLTHMKKRKITGGMAKVGQPSVEKRKWKKRYNLIPKYQQEWDAKAP
jgi:hypothetical protein